MPEASNVSAIFFTDQQNGWILTENSNGVKTLYLTVNGGASWRKGMSSPLIKENSEDELALPKQGHAVALSFINKSKGYVTVLDQGQPKLFITNNGGLHWKENVQFFNPSKYTKCKSFVVGTATLFTSNPKTGYVPVGCIKDDTTKVNGYFTSDYGKTWTLAPFGLPWKIIQSEANELEAPFFINDQVGWTIQGTTVLQTLNQGKDWLALPESEKLTDVLLEYNEIVKMQFYSESVGWLLVSKSDHKRSLLLLTEDGGITWRVL
ncbi:Ycf48-like protein [compost metagenome]